MYVIFTSALSPLPKGQKAVKIEFTEQEQALLLQIMSESTFADKFARYRPNRYLNH